MTFTTLLMIAIGLAMDALAVAISKGLAMQAFRWKPALQLSLTFGLFQGLMPLIGYGIGVQFSHFIQDWDHWVAFVLLSLIGLNMLKEGLRDDGDDELPITNFSLKALITLGIATSVDALAIGISFAFLTVHICAASAVIGVCTFALALLGVKSGHFLGKKFKSKAEILGAVILIAIGVKILFEHGVFTF